MLIMLCWVINGMFSYVSGVWLIGCIVMIVCMLLLVVVMLFECSSSGWLLCIILVFSVFELSGCGVGVGLWLLMK